MKSLSRVTPRYRAVIFGLQMAKYQRRIIIANYYGDAHTCSVTTNCTIGSNSASAFVSFLIWRLIHTFSHNAVYLSEKFLSTDVICTLCTTRFSVVLNFSRFNPMCVDARTTVRVKYCFFFTFHVLQKSANQLLVVAWALVCVAICEMPILHACRHQLGITWHRLENNYPTGYTGYTGSLLVRESYIP